MLLQLNTIRKKAVYDAKVAEKTQAEITDKAAQEQYEKDLAAYNTAYEKYQTNLATYKTAKAAYDAKVAEKAAADKANAEAKAKYDAEMAVYNAAKAQYDKDLQEYQLRKRNTIKIKQPMINLLLLKQKKMLQKLSMKLSLQNTMQIQSNTAKILLPTKQNLLNIKQLWHSTKMLKQPMIST